MKGTLFIWRNTFDAYDFKGNPLSITNQLAADYKGVVDWNSSVTLESETFTTTFEYDALNRVVSQVEPDGSEKLPYYNEAGLLEGVDVIL